MTLLTCAAVRRRLQAFHDSELAVQEMISVEGHVGDCPPCARDLRELRAIGESMRLASAPGPADDWTGLQPGVISRMRAEAHESWAARTTRAFDDLHLVWIGLASTAATVVCAGVVLGMLHFASPERSDSLAAAISEVSAPLGADVAPSRLGGRGYFAGVARDIVVSATLENSMLEQRDIVLALSAVRREGRGSRLELLTDDHDRREVADLIHALSQGRLEPAQFGSSPWAKTLAFPQVNLVWLVAHTTVKAKSRS